MKTVKPLTDAQRASGVLPLQLPLLARMFREQIHPLDPDVMPAGGHAAYAKYLIDRLHKCPAIAATEPMTGLVKEWRKAGNPDHRLADGPLRAPFNEFWAEFFEPYHEVLAGMYFEVSRNAQAGETIKGELYVGKGGYPVLGPMALWTIDTNTDGETTGVEFRTPVDKDRQEAAEITHQAEDLSVPLILLMPLLARKNITVASEPMDPREAKSMPRRSAGEPTWRYHFLTIADPHGKRRSSAGRSDGGGPERLMPWHVVRGHEAVYGMEGRGKLFGILTGRFWKYPHERGNAKNGTIHKDYAAAAPDPKTPPPE